MMSKNVDRFKNLIFSILMDADIGDNLRKDTLSWYRTSHLPFNGFGSELLVILEDVALNCSEPELRLAFFDLLVCQENWEEKPDSIFKRYVEALEEVDSHAVNTYEIAKTLEHLVERGFKLEQKWKRLVNTLGESQTIKIFSNCNDTIWNQVESSDGYNLIIEAKKQYAMEKRITTLWHLVALCHPGIYSNLEHDCNPIYYHRLSGAINDWPYWEIGSTHLLFSCGAITQQEQEIIELFGIGLAECLKSIPHDEKLWDEKLISSSQYQKLGATTLQELCQEKNILDVIYYPSTPRYK